MSDTAEATAPVATAAPRLARDAFRRAESGQRCLKARRKNLAQDFHRSADNRLAPPVAVGAVADQQEFWFFDHKWIKTASIARPPDRGREQPPDARQQAPEHRRRMEPVFADHSRERYCL